MREENQLKIIFEIIESYPMEKPLSQHLKNYFRAHPQMGSRDRRLASGFVYNYFRVGKAVSDLRTVERLTIANFICSPVSNPLLNYCLEKFSLLEEKNVALPAEEKINLVRKNFSQF